MKLLTAIFNAKETCTHNIILKQSCSTCYYVSGTVPVNFRYTFQECSTMEHYT